ncbi:hypothetical protein U8527_21135 [Kordia algicida OT-1]|uniref:Uncharacterized protein n=1 Tax=Kordia algicida OT-1 TaxID=391587 RepID=A9DL98_9FLAO|nr:hypothetical protein [Kordia algicida]EDP98515.1 hypothetical protein KAOT1_14897 [Kordia algicida OT-1]
MKDSLKKLKLKRNVVSTFVIENITGGYGPTDLMCNSVAVGEGGIGCHVK